MSKQPILQKMNSVETTLIQNEILRVGNVTRERYPFLRDHQDLIGFLILFLSTTTALAASYAIYYSLVPYWIGFIAFALATSIVHEMEHDLIHKLYFQGMIMNDIMLFVVWMVRWNAINPWVRRRLHMHHHRASGTESDFEEQAITNGQPLGLKRFLMLLDGGLNILLRPVEIILLSRKFRLAQMGLSRGENVRVALGNIFSYCPFGYFHFTALYSFVAYHVVHRLNGGDVSCLPTFIPTWLPVFSAYLWCMGFPNIFRQFLLACVSSNMHYYGDIAVGDVMHQTQVWHTWWTLPIDIFTFNFGSTHGIHHFVIRDTFYMRQIMAPSLYGYMREHGVRFNDFSSILRANRFGLDSK